MAGWGTCAVVQGCHVGLPQKNDWHDASWAAVRRSRVLLPVSSSAVGGDGRPRGFPSSGDGRVGLRDVWESVRSWVSDPLLSAEWVRKAELQPFGGGADSAHARKGWRRTSDRSLHAQCSHVSLFPASRRKSSVNDHPSTLLYQTWYLGQSRRQRPFRRAPVSGALCAVKGPLPGDSLPGEEKPGGGGDEQKSLPQERGGGEGVEGGGRGGGSRAEDDNGGETGIVLGREDILGGVVATSGVLLISGLGMRQLSHWGATSGWWSGDLSVALPAFYDRDHAIIAGCLWVSTSLLSFALYKAWDEFAAMMDNANRMLLDPLKFQDLIWIALLPGISEELLFRGALMPAISLDEKGALLAGIAFGAVHYGQLGRNWAFVLVASAIGTAYGLAAISTGNLGVPIAVHVANNLFASVYWKLNSRPNATEKSKKKRLFATC